MTARPPDKLRKPLEDLIPIWGYEGKSEACTALISWDIYSRQQHAKSGPIVKMPRRAFDQYVDRLLAKLGYKDDRREVGAFRFTVRVPDPLYPLALARKAEELYRSDAAYITSLIVFALDPDVPPGKGVPHHKLAPLMRAPKVIRDPIFEQLAKDFGDPNRKWPGGLGARIDQLTKQMSLL